MRADAMMQVLAMAGFAFTVTALILFVLIQSLDA